MSPMSEPAEATTLQVEDPHQHLPKLSIQLLFVWITLSAIGITVSNLQFAGLTNAIDKEQRDMLQLAQVLSGLGAGIAAAQLTAMGVLAYVWRQTKRMLTHPGHWLIWIVCIGLLLQVCTMMVSSMDTLIGNLETDWTRFGWQIRKYFVAGVRNVLLSVIPIGLTVFAAFRHRGLWRFCFFVSAIAAVLSWAVMNAFPPTMLQDYSVVYSVATGLLGSIPAVFFTYAALSEKLADVRRDWVHWVGIGAAAASGLIYFSGAAFALA